MVKMEMLQPPQPPSKFEFLEYLKFEYLEYDNLYWPTLLAEYGYAPTLGGLETLLTESIIEESLYTTYQMSCWEMLPSEMYPSYREFCVESTLAELKLLAEYGYEPTLADLDTSPYLLQWFEKFQSEKVRRILLLEEYFNGDWRSGREIYKVVITQRLYQTSPNSTQE